MGQIFNRSKMNLLEEYMTEKIAAFVLLLRQRGVQPVELSRACRALEADIVGKFALMIKCVYMSDMAHSLLWIWRRYWCNCRLGERP